MTATAIYQNNTVTIIKVISTGSAAGSCLIRYSNGRSEWVSYRDLHVLSWDLVA